MVFKCMKVLAEKIGMKPVKVAEGIIDVANANMERAIKVISVEKGFDVRDYEFPDLNEIPFTTQCQLILEIAGQESEILRNSKRKEEYLSTWCLQKEFKQKYDFPL